MVDSLRRLFSRKRRASENDDASVEMPAARKIVVQNSPLLELPDEILLNIVGFLDQQDLFRTRLAASHLNELAQPFIFERFDILHGKRAKRLAELLARDARRATWLRSVLVSTRHEEDRGLDQFSRYLHGMRNLKTLVLETPDCNARTPIDRVKWVRLQRQYEAIFKQSTVAVPAESRLLPHLESCTLHFVDDLVSLYPLTKYSSIFLHPALKSLTLSCACTDWPHQILRDYRQYKRSTSLEYLHLEECDFDPDSLEILLKFPKALKSLKISEGVRYSNNDESNTRPSRLHGDLNPGLLSHTLARSVASSLEALSLSLGYQRSRGLSINTFGRSLDLTPLTKLKHLDVSMTTLSLILSRPTCDHSTYRRLPPSLESIRVFSIHLIILRGGPRKPFKSCVFTQKSAHGLPNLRHVTYCYEYQALRENPLFRRGSEDTRDRIIAESKKQVISYNNKNYPTYVDSGVRVTIEVEVTPPGYIPPYLHNEEKPVTETMWDSNEPTFEALVWQDRARKAAEGASARATSSASVGGSSTNEREEDSDDDDAGVALMHLPPQAVHLFEMLLTQPAPPFQL